METKNKAVIRTLSDKYQLTIPKKFGQDLGFKPLGPILITEDLKTHRIIIESVPLRNNSVDKKTMFIEACHVLGKKWAKLGIKDKDIEEAIHEFRTAG